MRLFGYYALHSFVNQLKKLFKTWVLIFFAACMLMGVVIGILAASLEETVESNQDPVSVAEVQEEPGFDPGIEPEALAELIAGGAILAVFLFEAISADKNGSKIFLPADVNLLFPSPMKPQSVLLFRLATQMGTALLASVYIVFQLPNLVLNLGLSGWAAAALVATWFLTVLMGKLLQVVLYTVCASHPGFKKNLRTGIYVLIGLLAVGFFAFFKSGDAPVFVAADRFWNAPVTRWIPLWGWLKGFAMFIAETNWAGAVLCLALLAVSSIVSVYGIWHINADFYEDAMAKSEETAAMMERARSEKSSGTAVAKRRKKDRTDSLLRDGLRHGQGADVFFHKTLYNRYRFSHLGFFTRTMETYLLAAVGTAAAVRFYFGMTTELPVVLVLGVMVFFRAMGNPLSEDTGMDFFRLIPDSTWKKLFCSLLGGTVCCLLDLLLPLLAAGAVLMVNPLKLIIWLPVIVSVDFYSVSVVTFIDLSVPPSIGKTIKSIITVFFIYFGLLPDVALMGFGIALGHVTSAALGTTAVNLLLGFFAFSIASSLLQPKGKDYIATVQDQDLDAARRQFSRLGFSVFVVLVTIVAAQLAAARCFPDYFRTEWGTWLLTFLPQYLLAFPIGFALMRRVPAHRPPRKALGFGRGVTVFFVSITLMLIGNMAGLLITALIGLLQQTVVENPLNEYLSGGNLPAQFLFMVILAPLAEEYLFRKQLIDRMRIYGGKTAVILSALLFGLFHGNLNQFFYAFGLGLAFGYVYLNTGRLRYSVGLHMIINFMGGILSSELAARSTLQQEIMNGWTIGLIVYSVSVYVCGAVGLVLLCMNARSLTWPAGELELPKGTRFRTCCRNTGMVMALLGCMGLFVLSLIPR